MKILNYILIPLLASAMVGCDAIASRIDRTVGDAMSQVDDNSPSYPDLDMVKTDDSLPSQVKRYEGFRLSFNRQNHTPNWVAWELLAAELVDNVSRSNNFWQDDDIAGWPRHSDYTRSGYDRGHMIPAADQKRSLRAMEDCFVMANMCPQTGSLNSGAWTTLEEKCRAWAKRDSAIVIVAGPIYMPSDTQCIGEAQVRVPSAFFKTIIAPYAASPRGIAFIYPNMPSPGDMKNYVVTIDYVEEITGFDLYYNLPDEIEREIERTSSFNDWK